MTFHKISPGKNVPDEFNVVIEIPMNADPIMYEVDKESKEILDGVSCEIQRVRRAS